MNRVMPFVALLLVLGLHVPAANAFSHPRPMICGPAPACVAMCKARGGHNCNQTCWRCHRA